MSGDRQGLLKTDQLWKDTYPRDTAPRNNLASLFIQLGDYDGAVREALEANRLDSGMPFPYANLCHAYVALNRLAEAKAIAQRGIALRPAYGELRVRTYRVAYLEGDRDAMRRIEAESAAAGRLRSQAAELQSLEQEARRLGFQAAFAEHLPPSALTRSPSATSPSRRAMRIGRPRSRVTLTSRGRYPRSITLPVAPRRRRRSTRSSRNVSAVMPTSR